MTPRPAAADVATLHHLCEVPAARSAVAALIHHEFWGDVPGASVDGMAARLAQAVSADALPLCRVAMAGEAVLGVVNLIDYDDPNPRVGTPWLAGMVVVPAERGRGLGSRLVRTLLADAQRLGFRSVYLGTDGPRFYERLGAVVHEQRRADFWIMRFDLAG